jgi:hypothetical protein
MPCSVPRATAQSWGHAASWQRPMQPLCSGLSGCCGGGQQDGPLRQRPDGSGKGSRSGRMGPGCLVAPAPGGPQQIRPSLGADLRLGTQPLRPAGGGSPPRGRSRRPRGPPSTASALPLRLAEAARSAEGSRGLSGAIVAEPPR